MTSSNALGNGVSGRRGTSCSSSACSTSASSSTQTTILPAARSSLSMAVHKAFPKRFADIHPKYLSPGFSTLLFGAVAVVWYVALTLISPDDVLANSILALGFGIAFYYGLTGFACVFYYRRHIFKSFKNFIFIGLAPFLGAVILTVLFVIADLLLLRPGELRTRGPGLVPVHPLQLHHPPPALLREEGPRVHRSCSVSGCCSSGSRSC